MFPLRRCVWFLCFALAAPPAGNADDRAESRPSQAPGATQAATDADDPALLPVLEARAREQRCAGDLGQVAALRRRALRIALAAFGPAAPATVRAMAGLAGAYIDHRAYLDAEPLLIVAARMRTEIEENGFGTAVFAGLARVALARGDTGAALAWANRAIDSVRRNPPHASAEPLRVLGAALAAQERFEQARRVLDDALAFDRGRHGPEAAETARSLSQLGNLYLRWGRPDDALPLLQNAAAIDQARLGPTHPFIADDLHDLGLAYEALNRPERARRLFLAARAVLERGAGRDTPRVAYAELARSRIERRLGHVAAAEAAQRAARRILDTAEAEERRRERRA